MPSKHLDRANRVIADAQRILDRLQAGDRMAAIINQYGQARMLYRLYFANTTAQQRSELRGSKIGQTNAARGLLIRPGEKLHYTPLGTITCVKYRRGFRRWIKVDDRGSKTDNSMLFAQFLWLIKENRPHVPRGYRVVHADGDMTNDDPANLMLIRNSQSLEHMRRIRPQSEAKRLKNIQAAKVEQGRIRREARQIAQVGFECTACGFEPPTVKMPGRCPKCGASAWQKIRRAAAA